MSLENKLITATAPTLPDGFCFEGDWQALADYLIENATYEFGSEIGNAYYNIGDAEPAADNRIYPWIRTIGDVVEGVYSYDDGAWIRYHETPASANELRIWIGTPTELLTYDGGESAAITSKTGPFWEVYTSMEGRFPIGVNATDYALGATGGAATHTLTTAQIPAHTHSFSIPGDVAGVDTANSMAEQGDGTSNMQPFTTDPTGGSDPHNNLPPYRAVHFIKRTARIYRRAV